MSTRGTSPRLRPDTEKPVPPSDHAGDDLLTTFNSLRDELISTLWFVLGNRDDAQDVAQETFVKCWRARADIGKILNLRAWIFRIGLNSAKDLQRSAWNRRSRPLQGDAMTATGGEVAPMQLLEDRESLERIRQALFDLRPEEKEVFLLRQNAELTYEQIAELRHCPVGTVKTQMRSALQKLRKVLT